MLQASLKVKLFPDVEQLIRSKRMRWNFLSTSKMSKLRKDSLIIFVAKMLKPAICPVNQGLCFNFDSNNQILADRFQCE
jgi:hypothetical protein